MAVQISTKGTNYYVIDPEATSDHGNVSAVGSIAWAMNRLTTGGVVELVAGSYPLQTALAIPYDNIEIRGSGYSSELYVDQSTYDIHFINLNGKSNLSFRGIHFKGASVSPTLSKAVFYANTGTINNIVIESNFASDIYSIFLLHETAGTITNFKMSNNVLAIKGQIIQLTSFGAPDVRNYWSIDSNLIDFLGSSGGSSSFDFPICIYRASYLNFTSNNIFIELNAGTGAQAVKFSGNYCAFTNNTIKFTASTYASSYDVDFNCAYSSFSGNTIYDTNGTSAIVGVSGTTSNIVSSNTLRGTSNSYGFNVSSSTTNEISENKVSGCTDNFYFAGTTTPRFYYDTDTSKFETYPDIRNLTVRTVNDADATVATTDDVIVMKGLTANRTVNLPLASARTRPLLVCRHGSNSYYVTFTRSGSDTFNGGTSKLTGTNVDYVFPPLRFAGASVNLFPDSANSTWWTSNIKNEEFLSSSPYVVTTSGTLYVTEDMSTVYITTSGNVTAYLPYVQYAFKPITIVKANTDTYAITILSADGGSSEKIQNYSLGGAYDYQIRLRNIGQSITFLPVYQSSSSTKVWQIIDKSPNQSAYLSSISANNGIDYNLDYVVANTNGSLYLGSKTSMVGRTVTVTRSYSGGSNLLVYPCSGDGNIINGAAFYTLTTQYQSVKFTCYKDSLGNSYWVAS